MGDLSKSAQCIRIFLIIINILFFILGVIVFAIGIFLVVEDEDYSFITGSGVVSGAVLLIICGAVTMVITVLCIIAAIFKWRPILVAYAIVLVIIVILEIIAGILGFVFRDDIVDAVEGRVEEAISLYRVNEDDMNFMQDAVRAVDFVQTTFDCCGINNASDWILLNPEAISDTDNGAPPNCFNAGCEIGDGCVNYVNVTAGIDFNATDKGCGDSTRNLVTVAGYTLAGIGIAFGILEILGILFALFFCCCITQARKQTVV